MRIFLTGGAGYVGSACLRYIRSQGHEVVAYDNLRLGHRGAVPSDKLIVGDIQDTDALTIALKTFAPDVVMHFAAAAYVGDSVHDPSFYYHNNVAGSLGLLEAMRAAGIKRLLFSSTCSTYGDSAPCPILETTPQNPSNPYARTKLAIEWAIRDFARAYGMGYTLLRYFNAAGADPDGPHGLHGEDHKPETHLIPLVLQVALGQREKIQVFGGDYPTPDGTCVRDYIHTHDLATAHLLAAQAMNEKSRAVYNVGTGRGCSVLEVIRACEKVTGRAIKHEIVERREGDPPSLVADPSKLQNELGWRAKYTDIHDTIATAWQWHTSHPQGYVESPCG